MSFELFEHDAGFRATVPVRPGVLCRLKGMKLRRNASLLDVLWMMVVMLPATQIAGWVPDGARSLVLFGGFLFAMAGMVLINRRIEDEPTRILDVDRGHVRVAERSGRVLFSAPLDQVQLLGTENMRMVAAGNEITIEATGDLHSLAERFRQAKAAHGSRTEVPGQLEQLLRQ